MGEVIVVASGKGGTGKTTAVANLGAALALSGKLTVLVDMDMGLRNLDVALGLESDIVYDVSDIIDGTCTIDEVLVKDTRYENLYFIPSPQTRDASGLDEEKFKDLWDNLRNRFDYCIIDAPAGIDGGFGYALLGADRAVIVTLPETAALRDADRVISIFEDSGVEDIRLIINRVRVDMINQGIMMNVDDCMDILSIPIIGIVPDDVELLVSGLKGEIAVSNPLSKAGMAFSNVARRITGEAVPIMDFDEKEGILKRLKRLLKR
ncbi:MAG: septum site-determining protein MinD [Clostridia bacterium]|nr:septum site-determining protein MinD [Clostridia bacterium]